jgi:GTPase SAR1 family protein
MSQLHQADFFHVGGSLDPDAPSYVERPADEDLYRALKKGDLCLVLAPRQMGKSSLMVRVLSKLRQEGVRAGAVDFQPLGTQKDPERWFGAVVNRLKRSLNLKLNSVEWWASHKGEDAALRFTRFLEDVVLQEIPGEVVLFFDEVDSVLPLRFSDDFFTTIRAIYNERATNPTLKRLSFTLLGVATVSSFIRDRTRTPFNIGRSINLEDFDKASIERFRKVLGTENDDLIDRIFYWTNGQPYLVQKLAAAACSWPPAERTADRIDQEVAQSYLGDKIEQDIHLNFIQDYLLAEYEVRVRDKLRVYRNVLEGQSVAYKKQSLVHNNLKLSGIVRIQNQQLVIRNRIYENAFNLDWVQKHVDLSDTELKELSDARRQAFVPGYTSDIFVSYSHVDDIPAMGAKTGWVTAFTEELKTLLAQKLGRKDACKVWVDPELAEHVQLSPETMKVLRNTATFIIVLSKGYLASDWCRFEKNPFLRMIQQRLRSGSRIFIVEIDPIPDHDRLFEFGSRAENTYQFWTSNRPGKPPRRLGIPRPTSRYYERLNELSYDLVNELQILREQALQTSGKTSPVGLAMTPYPGLRPFESEEAHIFMGRDKHTERLVEKISYSRFVAVVGLSGCGKTSLVRAGLIATLASGDSARNWHVVEVIPDTAPLRNMARALLDSGVLDEESFTEEEISSMLQQGGKAFVEAAVFPKHANLLLFIDQFESLLRAYQHGYQYEVNAFVAFVLACVNQDQLPIYVVTTIRSEFIGECARFHGLPEALNAAQFLTPRMTREQLAQAIRGPAIVFGGEIEDQLVERLLDDLESEPDCLPILQHCLMRIWRQAQEAGISTGTVTMTLADHEAVGGLQHAFARHADSVFQNELTERQQMIAERMFRRFSDRRRTEYSDDDLVQLRELAAIARVAEEDVIEVAEKLRQLGRSFITSTSIRLTADSRLAISYDTLFQKWPRLEVWHKREVEAAELYRRLEQTARLWKAGKAAPWSSPDLDYILEWQYREKPTATWAKRYGRDFDLAMEFLRVSQQEHKSRQRNRAFRYAAAVAVAGVIGAGLLIWGLREQGQVNILRNELQLAQTDLQAVQSENEDLEIRLQRLREQNEQLTQRLSTDYQPLPQVVIREVQTDILQHEVYALPVGAEVRLRVVNYSLDEKFRVDYSAFSGTIGKEGVYQAPAVPGLDVVTIQVREQETGAVVAQKAIVCEIVSQE